MFPSNQDPHHILITIVLFFYFTDTILAPLVFKMLDIVPFCLKFSNFNPLIVELLMPANRISTFSIIIFWILFLYLFSTYKYVGLEANLQRLKWYLWDNMKFHGTTITRICLARVLARNLPTPKIYFMSNKSCIY